MTVTVVLRCRQTLAVDTIPNGGIPSRRTVESSKSAMLYEAGGPSYASRLCLDVQSTPVERVAIGHS
ncbi:hypothetical protein BO71DRAFT_116373 [Aspergillus ellipticus CBS 707.79]|uniref:Uncharacterized protein n=1 Tax=Aspergillus ellipticus CBS 707.79 TaxID=1448320 RepID=A0A319DLW6_9EURO|nr:hypothetical protein BO71DRAFT_116373 [Aspergillus ellipticus CBS 707.79]